MATDDKTQQAKQSFLNAVSQWNQSEQKRKLDEEAKKEADANKVRELFGIKTTAQTPQSKNTIKESLEGTERSQFGFSKSFLNDIKGFFGDIGELTSLGRTEFISNKDKKKGINDWDEYKKRMKQMSESSSADEYNYLYDKMIKDNIVQKEAYEQYQKDEKYGEFYKFEQAKSADKQTFYDQIETELSPIMQNTTNRYQIDAISKGIQKIENQYSMFYDNVMETYKDTRDDRILDEWDKIRKEYENDIMQFTKNWATNMVNNNMTYSKAYSQTLKEGSNEEFANGISKIERQLSNKMFKFTINQNLTDAGTSAATFNLLNSLDQGLLAAKNGITWGVKQVSNLLEETKQLAGRYDVAEELMNLRVFDEDASGFEKALGNVGWFANTMIDSLPAYGPAVIEVALTRKVEPGLLKNTDKLMDIWKAGDFKRFGTTLGGVTLKELALDNLVYDEVFQNLVGRPISNEDENINMMFNLPIDFLQGALQANAKWIKPAMKSSDFALDAISPNMLKVIQTSGDTAEDLKRLSEKVYILRGLETTEGTKEFKQFNKGDLIDINGFKESDPKLYDKIVKALNDASGYWERLSKYQGNAEDLLLGLEETMSRKEISKLSTLEKLDKASEKVWSQSNLFMQAGDSLMMGAKSIGKTLGELLAGGKLSEEDLRLIIRNISDIEGIDDLIIGLAKGDKELTNNTLVTLVNRGIDMSSSEVNKLYNSVLAKLLKTNPDLKELETIGTYYKGADGLYRNIIGDDTRYTVDELVNMLSDTSKEIFGSEPVDLMYSMNSFLENWGKALINNPNLELKQDITGIFSKLQGGNIFRNWDAKSEAQKKMISQIIKDAGFEFKKVNGDVTVIGTYDGLLGLRSAIIGLNTKPLNKLTAEDVAAFKILYAGEFINAFDKYLLKVGNISDVEKGLAEKGLVNPKFDKTDFAKEYRCWFESMFDIREVKDQKGITQKVYTLKTALDDGGISSEFQKLFENQAPFKDVESYAAQNIIQNITERAILDNKSDEELYNIIDKAITTGRYAKGFKKEILPVVNSIFNQVKWLSSLGMDAKETAKVIGQIFGELVVDEGTLRTLSRLDSDYLYKGIISKLILGNETATALYVDGLSKLFKDLDKEGIEGLNNMMNSVEVLGSKLRKTDQISEAKKELDKQLNKIDKRVKGLNAKYKTKPSSSIKNEIKSLGNEKKELVKSFKEKWGVYYKDGQIKLDEPTAVSLDRQILINKLQEYVGDINSKEFVSKIKELEGKFNKLRKFEKPGMKITDKGIEVNRIYSVSDDGLRLLADLTAYRAFANANLPVNGEAQKLSDYIYEQLIVLKNEKDIRKLRFNIGSISEVEPDVINLSMLGEAKLLSNIFSEGGLKYLVGNMMTNKVTGVTKLDWLNDTRLQLKNIVKRSGMKELGTQYLTMLKGIEKYIKKGDTAKEQIRSIIDTLNNSAILDDNAIIEDLIKSYNFAKANGETALMSNVYFSQQMASATNKISETISDLLAMTTIYDNVLSEAERKEVLDIINKLNNTQQLFDRMSVMMNSVKEANEQQIKKFLTTDFKEIELAKRGEVVNKGINPLNAPKRSKNLQVNQIRSKGTNERVDDYDVTKPEYDLGGKKLVIYDLETTSADKDADVLQLSYIVVTQNKNGEFKVERHGQNLFNTGKEINPEATKVHKITKEMVEDKPLFNGSDEYNKFKQLVEDDNTVLVGHNIKQFDNEVLYNAGINVNDDNVIDTLRLYEIFVDKPKLNYKLENVRHEFSNINEALKGEKGKAHNADYDTITNFYLLNYLSKYALWNEKIPDDKGVVDALTDMSKIEFKPYETDTSKSFIERQIFTEGDAGERVKAGNTINRSLDKAGLTEGEVVGLGDLLPSLGTAISQTNESRIITMFEGLKKILPEGTTIDKNKIFVGGNVKKAYEEYVAEAGFDAIPFEEFVLNRIVNNVLTENGLYNDITIEALNSYMKKASREDLVRRLVKVNEKGWLEGSSDTYVISQLLEKLYNDGLIGKGVVKNTPEYKDMMDDISKFFTDECPTDLIKFNKSYYNYILNGDGRGAYNSRSTFIRMMEKAFAGEGVQGDDVGKMYKYWNTDVRPADLVGQWTRQASRLGAPSVNPAEGEKILLEIQNKLDEIDEEIKKNKKFKETISNKTKEGRASRKRIDNVIRELEHRWYILDDEKYFTELDYNLNRKYSITEFSEYKLVDEVEEQKTVQEEMEEAYEGVTKEIDEEYDEADNAANGTENEIKENENFSNQYEEGASSADTLSLSRKTREGEINGSVQDTLESYIWNGLEDDIIGKKQLVVDNKFHIIEDDKSMRDYKGGQYNTVVSMDARLNGNNKEDLINKLNSLETKGDDKSISEGDKRKNAYIYNARNYVEGNDRRFTDEQYLKVYGLDDIVGKELHDGEVTGITIRTNWFDKEAVAADTSDFHSWEGNYDENFDLYGMLSSILETMKKGKGTFVVDVAHTTYKNKENYVSSISYSLDELWTSPIGKALLRKMDIDEGIGRYGPDAVMKTIENKVYNIAAEQEQKGKNLRMIYLDVIDVVDKEGNILEKRGPRKKWSDEVFMDSLDLSGETKWKYIKDLPESDKKSIANEIKRTLKEKIIKENGYKDETEIPIETKLTIDSIGPTTVEDVDKMRGYFSSGLYSYDKLDEIAVKNGYENMADFVYKTAVKSEGEEKAKETLGWSLMGDSRFRNEVYARYNNDIVKLYKKIDDYFGVSVDTFLDRMHNFKVIGNDGDERILDAFIPDFIEVRDMYEPGLHRELGFKRRENGSIINDEFRDETKFKDYEEVQLIHGNSWVSNEDMLLDAKRNVTKSDDYNELKNVNDPSEVVVRMYNKKTKEFEYGIIKITPGKYSKEGAEATTYEFYPFKGIYKDIDPLNPTAKNEKIEKKLDDIIKDLEDLDKAKDEKEKKRIAEAVKDEAKKFIEEYNDFTVSFGKGGNKELDKTVKEVKEKKLRLQDSWDRLDKLSDNELDKLAKDTKDELYKARKSFGQTSQPGLKGDIKQEEGIKIVDNPEGKGKLIEEQGYELGEREGAIMKYDWKHSSFKEVPAGARENGRKLSNVIVRDGTEDMAEMNALDKSTKGFRTTRTFSNWTNYDFFDQDPVLQQIIGERVRFIGAQGENLRTAINNFEQVLNNQGYTKEEIKEVYEKIRKTAHTYIGKNMGDAKEFKIDELPDELVEALNGVAKVFNDGGWTPVHQLATLSNDGFDGILKNIAHNHYGSALNYYKVGTKEKVKKNLTTIIQKYETREKQINNAVSDLVGDPLGTGAFYDLLTGVRSMWRFIKYGPLFPLTGVLMLANSAVMGNIRYAGEKRGVQSLMNNSWFNALIAKKGELVKVGNQDVKGLGMVDGLNRVEDIMFNSNTDLGGSWFDKVLDAIVKPLPENNKYMKKTKEAIQTALKGGTHSLYDLFMQGSIKTMAFAKALSKNGISVDNIESFVKAYNDGLVSPAELNKILGDTERIYSRFFTNSSTAFFSRHRFSRLFMFNALQGYVINRTDEMVSSIKNCVNWISNRHNIAVQNGYKGLEGTTWRDFVDYLQTDNQELQSFLMNILFSAKMGFYMDKMTDGGDMDTNNYRRYVIDTSDYLSSIEANFVYNILMAPFEGLTDYAEYTQNNYDTFDLGQGLTVAGLKTVSDLCSRFFREGKILNSFMDSIVAYGQTGKVDFAYDVLVKDFQKIADGLGRFQLVEGTNLYGLDTLGEDRDILGQILFNNDQTSNSGRVTSKLQSFATVDSILNGEEGSFWKDKLLPYLPIIGPAIQNAVIGTGYSFTAAKYDELIHIMDKDNIVQILNNWDYDKSDPVAIFGDSNIYSDEAIGRMYQELTAFDYPNKQQLSGGKFETGYEYSNELIKEEIFTKEMLDELGRTEQELEQYLLSGSQGKNKKAGLMKIMAASEAARPGSSKIVISYLASLYENDRIKEITGNKYGSWKDLSVQAQNDLQRETVTNFYPYMFVADKTSWYKAITEYISGRYELFDTLYKDDNLKGYVSTLGYMDMLMYQQAQDGNTNAKFIKNSWSMLSKYMKSEPARINAINYIMDSIEKSGMSNGQATSAKMGVLAANMDFYDKYYKNGMAQALYGDDLEKYNNYVWGVLQDLNDIGIEESQGEKKKGYGYSNRKPYNTSNPIGDNNVPMAKKFIPAAQKYLNGYTPSGRIGTTYTPQAYTPGRTLNWYLKYYEGLIKAYSDRLVKSEGKKYPAQGTENITFKTGSNNRGSIKGAKLTFPKHKSKEYRTNVLSNLPGSHG